MPYDARAGYPDDDMMTMATTMMMVVMMMTTTVMVVVTTMMVMMMMTTTTVLLLMMMMMMTTTTTTVVVVMMMMTLLTKMIMVTMTGVTSKLDYLVELNVGAVWLSPFYKSPMKDFGYDVQDFRDVDPIFGTLQDFDELLEKAHKRGEMS